MKLLTLRVPEQDWLRETTAGNGADRTASEQTERWAEVIRRLDALRGLGEDWDGLGASGPSGELVDSAVGLAHLLRGRGGEVPSRVVAGTAGTVILEWQTSGGTLCEVEIDRPFHADVMLLEPGQPAKHWELPDA
jgi:hypothetical protein